MTGMELQSLRFAQVDLSCTGLIFPAYCLGMRILFCYCILEVYNLCFACMRASGALELESQICHVGAGN